MYILLRPPYQDRIIVCPSLFIYTLSPAKQAVFYDKQDCGVIMMGVASNCQSFLSLH